MILQTENLEKTYMRSGVPFNAVECSGFTLESGSFTILMGQSGCGKSTLFHLLTGMCRPTCGKILYDGTDIVNCSERELAELRRTDIGYILQGQNLLPNFTVLENICMPSFLGRPRGDEYDRALELIEMFGLGALRDEVPGALSGGEQRRVAIARAFSHDPKIVIADEPTSNLDSENSAIILRRLRDAAAHGTAVLMSTHDRSIPASDDTVWHMDHGKISDAR